MTDIQASDVLIICLAPSAVKARNRIMTWNAQLTAGRLQRPILRWASPEPSMSELFGGWQLVSMFGVPSVETFKEHSI